jgi:hypothetical protein
MLLSGAQSNTGAQGPGPRCLLRCAATEWGTPVTSRGLGRFAGVRLDGERSARKLASSMLMPVENSRPVIEHVSISAPMLASHVRTGWLKTKYPASPAVLRTKGGPGDWAYSARRAIGDRDPRLVDGIHADRIYVMPALSSGPRLGRTNGNGLFKVARTQHWRRRQAKFAGITLAEIKGQETMPTFVR